MRRSLRGDIANAGAWSAIWFVGVMFVGGVIGIGDPDSLDPGDTAGMAMVMGVIGVLSGAAFSALVRIDDYRPAGPRCMSTRAILACGFAGTAIIQTALLGHGDAGLTANVSMALGMCCAFAMS